TVPFMRAYTELLVKTCHRRGAYAIGGMAAFIPSRRDPEVNRVALEKVHDDKIREVTDGFDGTWVAHPDLVREAMASFNSVRHAVRLSGGAPVTADLVRRLELEELARIRREIGADTFDRGRFEEARGLFEEVALSDTFVEFLTIPAYRHID